jgi:hypothetical protein
MIRLPDDLAAQYVPAGSRDIRSWSFGAVSMVRNRDAADWREKRRTLDDPGIFGPVMDHRCACGKYRGERHAGIICDLCGVKIADSLIRRTRMAHINLAAPIEHPFAEAFPIEAVPVLPAAFHHSPAGSQVAEHYEYMLRAIRADAAEQIGDHFERIVHVLLPLFTTAHAWNLQDTLVLARGLALMPVRDRQWCRHCGYVLEGLETAFCPSCGISRKS